MTKAFAFILGAAAIVASPQAFAQDAAPSAADQAAPNSSFSEADIAAYAGVAAQINKIQADAALSEADKQAQMAAAVQQSGMDISKFNAITEASKTDPVLKQKLHAAVQ